MAFSFEFDASQIAPAAGSAVCFPLADYAVEITAATVEQSKNDPNKGFIKLSFTVQDGPYKGMSQDMRYNIYGQSETVTRIAYSQLSAVSHVTGKMKTKVAEDFIGGRLIATIGPQDNDDKYSEVKAVKDVTGAAPVMGKPYTGGAVAAAVVVQPAIGNPVPAAAPAQGWQTGAAAPVVTAPTPAAAPAGDTPPWANAPSGDKPSWLQNQ